MISDEDIFYIKIVALDEIYNFLFFYLFFSFDVNKMLNKLNKVSKYINCVHTVATLEKLYLSYMMSNGNTFCMKILASVNYYALGHAFVNCYAFGSISWYSVY